MRFKAHHVLLLGTCWLFGLFALPRQVSAASAPVPGAAVEPEAQSAITVQTRLTPEPSNVGDVLKYEVVVAFPRGVTVNLPTQLDFAPLHFVESTASDVEATGESLRKTFVLSLQHFALGDAKIPAFELTTVDAQGAIETVPVPAFSFTVEALLANEVDPARADEDPPVSIEYPNDTAEIAIYAVVGGIVLGLLGWLIARRFLRRERVIAAPPPIPPHEVALGALHELEQGELLERGDVVPFYLQLTEIAKGYLEGRFGVPSLDRTTEEIRQALVRQGDSIQPLSPDDVIAFLQRCDLVKFARFAPDESEASDAIGEVRGMVERTLPQVAPVPAMSNADEAAEAPSQGATEESADEDDAASSPQGAAGDDATDVSPSSSGAVDGAPQSPPAGDETIAAEAQETPPT